MKRVGRHGEREFGEGDDSEEMLDSRIQVRHQQRRRLHRQILGSRIPTTRSRCRLRHLYDVSVDSRYEGGGGEKMSWV